MKIKLLVTVILTASLALTACSAKHVSQAEDTNKYEIASYLPNFSELIDTEKDLPKTMTDFTFIKLHCDGEQKWAYIQDFKNDKAVSPLYLYEFVNDVTIKQLLEDLPERSKQFEVDGEPEDFDTHITPAFSDKWKYYQHDDFTLLYANEQDDEGHFFNHRRVYKNGKPYVFVDELSDTYKVNELEVTEDAYIWIGKDN